MLCVRAGASPPCSLPAELAARLKTQPSANLHAEAGRWFGDRSRFNCAANEFSIASKTQPDSAEFAYMWGLSLFSSGDTKGAVDPLRRAVKLDSRDVRPHLVLGTAFDRDARRADAEAEWRAALRIDPDSAPAIDALARDLIDDKDYAAVIALLDQRQREHIASAQQVLDLGIAYARADQLEKAAGVLREGLNSAPDSVPLADELASVLAILERPAEAIPILELALQHNPRDLRAHLIYLRLLVSANSDKAVEAGEAALILAPHDGEILYLNGVAALQKGDPQKARALLEQAVTVDASSAKFHFKLGQALLQLNDPLNAERELRQAIQLGDTEPAAQFELAMALRNQGKANEAKEQIRVFEQAKSRDAVRVESARASKAAQQAVAAGDTTQAAALYREALRGDPDNALLLYKLALTLDKLHDAANEQSILEHVVQLDPTLAEARNQLGYLAVQRGDTTQAEVCFLDAVKASPAYTVAWINLAASLASEARWQEANDALGHALAIAPDDPKALQLKDAIAAAQTGRQDNP